MDSTELATLTEAALTSLLGVRYSIAQAPDQVPALPGLYAVHAADAVWEELGLESLANRSALYIGKAEVSLASRELKTHFDICRSGRSKTGSSTLRRSFAALLREDLHLQAIPRNTSNPGYFSNYALEPEGDERLTDWMHDRLALSFWCAPPGSSIPLVEFERKVLRTLEPPLNIKDIDVPLVRLRNARTFMANEARNWEAQSD